MEEFDKWIADKLLALESDDNVITDYIKGILTGDESQEEQQEALEGILSGIMETGIEDFCQEIFSQWKLLTSKAVENGAVGAAPKLDLEDQLSKIMEQHNIAATVTEKPRPTLRDKDVKAAILQQYAEISDVEDDGEEEDKTDVKNSNRDDVTKEEQERRERLKAEAAAKREKDKLDREKQKAQQAERKDKEKKRTQKGEKRR